MRRSPSLDVVRGIAILMVLVWHYLPRAPLFNLWVYLPKVPELPFYIDFVTRLFWSGVDLFFVLSGFLIGGILLHNVGARNYFKVFYIRRAARILPPYWLLLLSFVVLVYLHPKSIKGAYTDYLPFWSYLTFTQNFWYALRGGFSANWTDVTWSLAIEEQFYVFLSVLIRYTNKKSLAFIAGFLILLAPVLRSQSTSMEAYVLPLQRADSLMLGVLLALVWQSKEGKGFLYRHVGVFRWSLVPLLLGAAFLAYKNIWIGDPVGHSWLALLYGDVVVLAAVANAQSKSLIFSNRFLEWLGLRSYGIYLLHKPLQIAVPFLLTRLISPGISLWIVAPVTTLVLFIVAEVSYRFLEKPIMDMGHRFKYI